MLKKCLIVAVVMGCFSFVEAKAQDCPRTPLRSLINKVREVQPVRTFFKKAYDAKPIRTLLKKKPLRSLLKGRSCSYYKSKQIENSTIPIPLVPAPVPIPDA